MRGRLYDFNSKKAPGINGAHVIVDSVSMHRIKYPINKLAFLTLM